MERESRIRGLEIVYEDEFIIVVNKAAGLLTISTGDAGEVTAYSLLTDYVRRRDRRQRIFIVHRLDRDTSGLLVFAKTERVKRDLQDGWNDNVIERTYIAVTAGCPPRESGTITSWLTENPKSKMVYSCRYDNGGRKAVTHFKLIRQGNPYCLVEFDLETGRKNQIRVHAAAGGFPVAGDRKYGQGPCPAGRLCLHARSLSFRHPVTAEVLRFSTPTPKVFKKMID